MNTQTFPDGWTHNGPIGSTVYTSHGYTLFRSAGPYVVLVSPTGYQIGTFTEQDAIIAMQQAIDDRPVTLDPDAYTSFETARIIPDYPYGNRRTTMKAWIEYRPKYGYRYVTCTLNPKTQRWNKPKAGTYTALAVLTWDPKTGHIRPDGIGYHARIERIDAYETEHGHILNDTQRDAIKWLRSARHAESQVTWRIASVTEYEMDESGTLIAVQHEGSAGPHQTLTEQAEIMRKLTTLAYQGKI